MVIQLALLFTLLAVQFRHLLQTIEHGLHDFVICSIDSAPYFQIVGTDKLCLNATHKGWEILDKLNDAAALLGRQPCLLNVPDLFVLAGEKVSISISR